jgi:hypothetical protein
VDVWSEVGDALKLTCNAPLYTCHTPYNIHFTYTHTHTHRVCTFNSHNTTSYTYLLNQIFLTLHHHCKSNQSHEHMLVTSLLGIFCSVLFCSVGLRICPTHSKCWFGLLSCGHVKESNLVNNYVDSNNKRLQQKSAMLQEKPSPYNEHQPPVFMESIPSFLGWSIRALVAQSRVNGREVVVPSMKLLSTRLSPSPHSSASSPSPSSDKRAEIEARVVEVMIGEYVLTIPGSVQIETRLLSLYPGRLFNFSSLERYEGLDLLHHTRLADTNLLHIGPGDIAPVTSMHVNSSYAGHACFPSSSSSSSAAKKPLPYCKGGANPGRWIRLPASIADGKCHIDKLLREVEAAKHPRRVDQSFLSPQDVAKAYTARLTQYFRQHAAPGNFTDQWLPVTEPSTDWSGDYSIYMEELAKYANGPACALAFVDQHWSVLITKRDRLSIFAPYECRYRIFDTTAAQQCLTRNQNAHPLVFNGDSVNDMMLQEANLLLDVRPAMSAEERKATTHLYVKNGKNVRNWLFSSCSCCDDIHSTYITRYMIMQQHTVVNYYYIILLL